MPNPIDNYKQQSKIFPQIKVIGIGGAGGVAVSRMAEKRNKPECLEYIAINTEIKALDLLEKSIKKIRIGKTVTKGLGTGMNPEMGRLAMQENKEDVKEAIKNSDMIFIIVGVGGGTGSGAAPIVAKLAKELGILTMAIIILPFDFEGKLRKNIAEQALKKLSNQVDAIITISNNRLLEASNKEMTFLEGFELIDKILNDAVYGVSNILTVPGLINIDFADIKSIMKGAGTVAFSVGRGRGISRAKDAVKNVLENSFLDISTKDAKGVLFVVTGPQNLRLREVNEIAKMLTEHVNKNAKIIFGATIDNNLSNIKKDEIKLTLIITGFSPIKNKTILFPLPISRPKIEEGYIKSNIKLSKPNIKLPKTKKGSLKKAQEELSEDELEIPAFLRKKQYKK